jgi:L-ascorbate metabolism protein UlaG (beta-lactamase superfamily)
MSARRRWPKVFFVASLVFVAGGLAVYASACTAMGASASGARLERMSASPQWAKDHFENRRPAVAAPLVESTVRWLTGSSDYAVPDTPIEPLTRARADYDKPPASGLRVTWLGHSTLLLEIDGRRVLMDPVWGERPSPLPFMGPERWYAPPLPLDELPDLDAILISHDHYDHLDHPSVLALMERGTPWIVPLGIGAHLEYWGMPAEQIVELDWWQSHRIGEVTLTATPARHFSGRTMPNMSGGPTLWAGWSVAGPEHRAYYSGDTSLFDELVEIGERLGPFDLTMIESGAYDPSWADVHLGPEQAVRAHELVRGKVMLPVHWGLFDLALHGWTEPIERVLAAAEEHGVTVLSPQPGEMLEPATPPPTRARWWPEVPWVRGSEAPVQSSGVQHLMER